MKTIFLLMIGFHLLQADMVRDSETGIVTDNTTHLQWQDNAISEKMNWLSAIEACEELTLGGYSDWRLPNINELKSIRDTSKYNPAIKNIFQNTASGAYWTSTTLAGYANNAWNIYFHQGGFENTRHKNELNYVRCVRDANKNDSDINDDLR